MSGIIIGLAIGFLFGVFIQPIAKIAKWISNFLTKGEEEET